ncbi:PTS glucose transporter subunit IIA [Oceanisphaera avium]|uniref:PTS system glucose-specific EIIA component n=1 Tax=Oceanisphaera avium TaxID=1903694 RepID=A0A1Y0CX57_9GAMM|nr:PTS glucose transporter subunit IIA [Oceanisphaera avium]ART79920.1 PTS glucose transporter subunit IIA [Oceanisphaera avium]
MSLFNKLKRMVVDESAKVVDLVLLAPLSGEVVPLAEVPDVVFAEKIIGDGLAIKPSGNKMVAPCDGVLSKIFEHNQAFAIDSDAGLEVFVHFGVDTVELKGEGFTRIAQQGQRVSTGDVIIEFDLSLLEAKAKSTLTSIIISNMDAVKALSHASGAVTLGTDIILSVKK